MSSRKLSSKNSSVGSSISRAASKFLMGSSDNVRRASYWKTQDAEDEGIVADVATASNAEPTNEASPWWFKDDLWNAEDDEPYELPSYPPPSYEEIKVNRIPGPDTSSEPATVDSELSAASLLASKPSLNRSLTAVSLRESQDDISVSYKGRGRGRRRFMMKRTASLSNLRSGPSASQLAPIVGDGAAPQGSKYAKRPSIHRVSVPYFTILVTLIDVIMMIWEFIVGHGFAPPKLNPMLGPNGVVLIAMGGKWVPSIIHGGEWWRFFTSVFLHGGLVHIGLNLLSQTKMLWDLEKVHGTFRIAPIYILSGAGGMVLSAVFLPNQVTVGASGAIFGFHGVLLVDLVKNWAHVKGPKMKLLMVGVSILIAFGMGLFPGIDNFAHFGGLVVGLLSAFVFLPSMHIGGWSVGMRLLQVCVALPLLIAYFVGFLVPFYVSWKGNSFCSWCHYIACLPFWSTCNGGGS